MLEDCFLYLFSAALLFSRKGRWCEKKKGRRIICTRKEEGEKKG